MTSTLYLLDSWYEISVARNQHSDLESFIERSNHHVDGKLSVDPLLSPTPNQTECELGIVEGFDCIAVRPDSVIGGVVGKTVVVDLRVSAVTPPGRRVVRWATPGLD